MKTTLLFLLLVSPFVSHAGYHLFNPTPQAERREFITERPTRALSGHTVDAGHLQVESEILNYSEHDLEDERRLQLFMTDFRLGILPDTEVQFEVSPYIQEVKNPEKRNREEKDGLGNVYLRAKQSLVGNDGGFFAMAITPFVVLPTGGMGPHERTEGGLIVPMDFELSPDNTLELSLQIDNENKDEEEKWQTNLTTVLSLDHEFSQKFEGFVEIYHRIIRNPVQTNETALDFAVQYSLTDKIKIDAGTFVGVSPEARDEYFIGTSFQF